MRRPCDSYERSGGGITASWDAERERWGRRPGSAASGRYAAAVIPAPVQWLSSRAAKVATITGAGLLAGCWLAGAAVSRLGGVPGIPLDSAARSVLESLQSVGPIDAVSQVLAVIGQQPVSIVVAVALGVAIVVRWGLAPGLAFGLASVASAVHVIAMKTVVQRPGPVLAFFEGLGSFPSGHTANAAVIATFGGFLVRRRWARVAGAVYVALVAVSRVVIGAHWFTDTVVGAAEGAGMALLVLGIWSAIRLRRSEGIRA